jgi:hypothetical protein
MVSSLLRPRNLLFVLLQRCKPESKDRPLGGIPLVEVDSTSHRKCNTRFLVTARGEQIQYVKLVGIPKMVPGVKSIVFEAKTPEIAAEWLFRLKKSACMGSFLDGAAPPTPGDGTSDADRAGPPSSEE